MLIIFFRLFAERTGGVGFIQGLLLPLSYSSLYHTFFPASRFAFSAVWERERQREIWREKERERESGKDSRKERLREEGVLESKRERDLERKRDTEGAGFPREIWDLVFPFVKTDYFLLLFSFYFRSFYPVCPGIFNLDWVILFVNEFCSF